MPLLPVRVVSVLPAAESPSEPFKREAGIKVGLGESYAGVLRHGQVFGLAHVRAPPQQVGRQPQGRLLRESSGSTLHAHPAGRCMSAGARPKQGAHRVLRLVKLGL